jgi:dipeptidyl aminopeptidase/acylaminoacyl peptidase
VFEKHPFDISSVITGLGNILIVHGGADQTVPISHAQEILARASDPKKLVVFSRSDHRMSHPADQQTFVQQSAMWFQTYLTEY